MFRVVDEDVVIDTIGTGTDGLHTVSIVVCYQVLRNHVVIALLKRDPEFSASIVVAIFPRVIRDVVP